MVDCKNFVEGEFKDCVPICIDTSRKCKRLPTPEECYIVVEYSGDTVKRGVVCGRRGVFLRTIPREYLISPLGSAGVTTALIFTSDGLATSTGTVACLRPFCAVSDANGNVVSWLVNGTLVPRNEFQPAADVIREPVRGKGYMNGSELRTVMVAYYTPTAGNGTTAGLKYRTWGAPVVGVAAIEGVGSALQKTEYLNTVITDQKVKPETPIGSRPDVMQCGYLLSYVSSLRWALPLKEQR